MRRREFLLSQIALAGAIAAGGGALAASTGGEMPPAKTSGGKPGKPKLGMRLPPGLSDADLQFLRERERTWCRLDVNADDATYEKLARTKEHYEKNGIRIWTVMNRYAGREGRFGLGEPGVDERIEHWAEFIRTLGRLGINTNDMSWVGWRPKSQVYTTSTEEMSGIRTRIFDEEEFKKIDERVEPIYTAEQVRANLARFLKKIMPVAEEAGVRIAMHPDDPPIDQQGGVARILHHIDHYRQAFALADSPNYGANFCVGTWGEGGDRTGASVTEAIRELAAQDRLFCVHFRNVKGPLPRLQETFMDNGYMDMQAIMDTLVEVGFEGILVPDHIPHFAVDDEWAKSEARKGLPAFQPAGTAYSAGSMRSMLRDALRKHGVES